MPVFQCLSVIHFGKKMIWTTNYILLNIILINYQQVRGLSFINRYASSNSKISRWDIIIRSFNMTINFLPNTQEIIKVTDMFTRQSLKGDNKNKRIGKTEIDKFLTADFSGIPDLKINDAMHLINNV